MAHRNERREWNRGPLQDCFPRMPNSVLEILLDKCIDKNFTYNLSQSKPWNTRRYTSIVVAHVRHNHSDYETLLRQGVERYAAREQSGSQVWAKLREWCPWDDSNDALERCFRATLLRPEERDTDWDPMDVDDESDYEADPMDLD